MNRTRLAVATAAVVLASVGTGCSQPMPTFSNGSVSACYRAIPAASAVLHEPRAKLLGVHRLPADLATDRLPPADRAKVDQDATVCAVAWQGHFSPGQVAMADPSRRGPFAIVLVSSHQLKVVASYVLTSIPRKLRGRFM